jgi:serine/threonine protein kinase
MKIGTILVDRYQIREQLSKKAGRRTFLAQDLQSEDLVIIKILRFDPDFQWDELKLFEREAATLQYLDHPAIPKYLDYFDVEESNTRGFALVQSYINAPSLERVITKGRKFSESEAIELADRLLSILTYLHDRLPPVIHRDIKPSNILLTSSSDRGIGDVYLVDFGSVQTSASKEDGTITIVGTYGYIAHEQFGGKTTTASDLYSLGMTIIYLLTGSHPFELPEVNGQVKFTAEVTNKFRRWLEKMTQPYLEKRFDSAKSARISLAAKDGSYGDFIHLKPRDSEVKLYRYRDRMEIDFKHLDSIAIGFSCLYVIGYFFAIYFACQLTSIGGFIVGIFGFAALTVYHIFGAELSRKIPCRKIVSIDLQKKSLFTGTYYEGIKQIKWNSSSSIDLDFDTLVYYPGYTFNKYFDENSKLRHGEVKTEPVLYIHCGSIKHYISNNGLSQAELWWLAQELSDFLGLELQIIHQIPRLPPPPSD